MDTMKTRICTGISLRVPYWADIDRSTKIRRYSASQIKTYNDCPRKWAHRYIDHRESPPNKYALWGIKLHKDTENYLNGKSIKEIDNDNLKIILPSIKHLPQPGDCTTESRFDLGLIGLGALVGYIDIKTYVDDIPINIDIKTTSDLRWALTPEELASDVQSVIYAKARMLEESCRKVRNRWVYMQRNLNNPATRKVEAEMYSSEVDEHMANLITTIQQMGDLYDSGSKAKDVDPKTTACDKYGGCPYKEFCNLTGKERLRSFIMNQSMKEKLAARMAEKSKKTHTPTETEEHDQVNENSPSKASPINPPKVKPKAPAKKPAADPVVAHIEKEESEDALPDMDRQLSLYVDCYPTSGSLPPVSSSALADYVNMAVEKEHGVAHYRLVPDTFGGAPALAQTILADKLDQEGWPPAIYVDSKTAEGRDLLPLLESLATLVVRGL